MNAKSAFYEAYKAVKNPVKNATNPFLKNKYADLGTVIDCVKEELTKVGVYVIQECHMQPGDVMDVTTSFVHAESNTEFSLNCSVKLKELSPQGSMAAFTYGRRYALLSAFLLAAEDDDGNAASGRDDTQLLNASTPAQAKSNIASILNKGK